MNEENDSHDADSDGDDEFDDEESEDGDDSDDNFGVLFDYLTSPAAWLPKLERSSQIWNQ